MGLGVETLEELDVFAKALLPTLSAAVAASGGMVSAGAKQVATVFFTNLLLSVIRKVLLPLLYGCIVAAAADAMIPGHSLKKIGTGIRKGVTWALTGVMLLFTGFLTLTRAASSAADALTMQMTRSAISAAVPVVGSIISDATGTVLAGAGMLKSAVGVFGMLAVLAICLTPFLTMAVQYLLYKLAAFFGGNDDGGAAGGTDRRAGGTGAGLMLGMTGELCAAAAHLHYIFGIGGGDMIWDTLRSWLTGIIAAGIVLSVLYALLPKGRWRPIARAAGGVALLLVILRPVVDMDMGAFALSYDDYEREIQALTEEYRQSASGSLHHS